MQRLGRRLSTGFSTLDQAARGGVPQGKLVILVGAPSSYKSTCAVHWSHLWEAAGAFVAFLAADESPDAYAVRFGQLAGFRYEDLEAEQDDARRAAAGRLASRKILLLDGGETLLEDAATALEEVAGDLQRVLVVDSLQTVRSAVTVGQQSRREEIGAVVTQLRAFVKGGTIVVATSEMARSGYRSGDRTQDISALAAAKESGAIEYGADLILGLRSVREEVGQVDVEVAKNRLGPGKPEFRLRFDFESTALTEMATSAAGPGRVPAVSQSAQDIGSVRLALAAHPGVAGRDNLRALVKGVSTARLRDAVRALEQAGEIENRGNAKRPRLYLRSNPTESTESTHPTVVYGHPEPDGPDAPYRESGRQSGSPVGCGNGQTRRDEEGES